MWTTPSPPAVLVCEGRCSAGTVQAFDDALLRAKYEQGVPRLRVAELELARQFVYTTHQNHIGNDYRCLVCGTARRFGH